jgi:hypothetical protein
MASGRVLRHLSQPLQHSCSDRLFQAASISDWKEVVSVSTAMLEKYAQELDRVNKRLSTIFSAILIDEVQDLTGAELRAVALLTKRIMVAGDDRQRIQGGGEGLDAAVTLGLKPIELEFHYRIGRRICEAADIVLPLPPGVKPLFPRPLGLCVVWAVPSRRRTEGLGSVMEPCYQLYVPRAGIPIRTDSQERRRAGRRRRP